MYQQLSACEDVDRRHVESARLTSAATEPLTSAAAVLRAELMLPLDARLPGTWT